MPAAKMSVTELNSRVKDLLTSADGLSGIWLVGEISNMRVYSSGHAYFTIKDPGSQIRAVMFRSALRRLDFQPTDSMKVEAYGHVDMYVPSGSYQFIVENMRRSGLGELYQKYLELKNKLEAEGLFSKERKRKIPVYPRTIGVVTSPSGAVIHDIITTTARRFPVDILLAPAQVQGEGAWRSIVAGIELLNKVGVDVIIVGRGGGSIEDLWAFNEEPVARAIAASKVPVISSVGHETDFTIADFVADERAATPTAAAERAVRDKAEIHRELDGYTVRMNKALSSVTQRMRARFAVLDTKLDPRRARDMVDQHLMRLDDLSSRMANALGRKTTEMHGRLARAEARLAPSLSNVLKAKRMSAERLFARIDPAAVRAVETRKARFGAVSANLDAINPYSVLSRGYSFVAGPDGKAITSVRGLEPGSEITVRMRDGRARAEIKDKKEFE